MIASSESVAFSEEEGMILENTSTHAETVSMWGEKGTDTLSGGLGDDFLNGGGSNDIQKETCSDVIIGGSGKDKLNGILEMIT